MEKVSPKYSVIIYKQKLDTELENNISNFLKEGIVVYLFTNMKVNIDQQKNKLFLYAIENYFLNLISTKNDYFEEGIKAVDGQVLDNEFYEKICKAKNNEFNSEYYGYSDIILANNIKIKKILTYNEIIENMLVKDKTDEELSKFIKAYKLNEQDKERFSKISFDTWLAIKYFQDGQTGIYKEDTKSLIKKYYKRQ